MPEGWEWTRLGSVFSTATGSTPSTKDSSLYGTDYPFYKPTDLDAGYNVLTSEDFVSKKGYCSGRQLPKFSVLVTCIGTIGKTGYIRKAGICNQQINAILPTDEIMSEYVYFCMCSQFEQQQIQMNSSATTLPILNKRKFDNLLFLIPPHKQQLLIVDKIQSLLSSVDEIQNNQAILRNTVTETKAKILDLAIRGKLVPQDSNDEPASVLLERISSEKEELIKQGKIKRDKKESVIFKGDDNSYYLRTGRVEESLEDWRFDDLPETWKICCLGELCDYGNCINVNTEDIAEDAWILDLEDIEKDTGTVLKKVTKNQRNSVSTKHKFHSGQVLYSKLRPYLNKVVLSDADGYCTSEILPLEFKNCVLPEYARYYLMSGTFIAYANHCSYGVKMPRLGTTDGKKAIFSLPPLSEQKRIVETIDFCFVQLNKISEALA